MTSKTIALSGAEIRVGYSGGCNAICGAVQQYV
jgi:hypothetical protein